MQAPHVDYVKLSWTRNAAEIFSRGEVYFSVLSAAEEICESPLPELELLCRPCDRRQQTTRIIGYHN